MRRVRARERIRETRLRAAHRHRHEFARDDERAPRDDRSENERLHERSLVHVSALATW
jgi:hypothetical protein